MTHRVNFFIPFLAFSGHETCNMKNSHIQKEKKGDVVVGGRNATKWLASPAKEHRPYKVPRVDDTSDLKVNPLLPMPSPLLKQLQMLQLQQILPLVTQRHLTLFLVQLMLL